MLCRVVVYLGQKWLAAWGQHDSAISPYEGRRNASSSGSERDLTYYSSWEQAPAYRHTVFSFLLRIRPCLTH